MPAKIKKTQKELKIVTFFTTLAVILCTFLSVHNSALGQVNSFPYNEGFEGSLFPPQNWVAGHVEGNSDWEQGKSNPHSGEKHAYSENPAFSALKRLDVFVSFDGQCAGQLSYWMSRSASTGGTNPRVLIQCSIDGVNFMTLRIIHVRTDLSEQYKQFTDVLPNSLDNQPDVTLRWEHTEDGGRSASVRLDDVEITGDDAIAMELGSFSATGMLGKIILCWTTQTETENLGFHVYRSMQADGEYSQINPTIIPGVGNSPEAHTYSYTDHNVEVGKTYYYKLADVDFNGKLQFHGPVSATVSAPSSEYTLHQSYPNPFNSETSISYTLKSSGVVTLTIPNVLGQIVRTLVDAQQGAGSHSVLWNGCNDHGQRVGSGVYLYRLQVNGFSRVKRLVLSK